MDALTNANTVYHFQDSGLTPIAIPKATSSQTGVSVEYVRAPQEKSWFLFRASYGREDLASDLLINAGYYSYVPKRIEMTVVDGHRKMVLNSLLPNLVFSYMSEQDARKYVFGQPDADDTSVLFRLSGILSFYYNHCKVDEYGKNPPLQLSCREMENFILATCTHDEHLLVLRNTDYTFRSEEEVEVTDGRFKNVRGRVIRAGRQQRILIQLTDFEAFATAYIPSAFLRPVVK